MGEAAIAGWDVGGAHLKAALLGPDGRLVSVMQIACPLWQGVDRLEAALTQALGRTGAAPRNAVTMTAEMTDLFASRAEGVGRLCEIMQGKLAGTEVLVYAGGDGFLGPADAALLPERVASANWLAGATFTAGRLAQGLFVDIGSTTSDIIPFAGGKVLARGYADHERLLVGELVYSGVTRTPVFAVADTVLFQDRDHPLIPEFFATMADVHRLSGGLPDDADPLPAADGKGKDETASARRLARMIGRDLDHASMDDWRRLARRLAGAQRERLARAMENILGRCGLDGDAPIVGAGIGRFMVPGLARRLGRAYVDFSSLVKGGKEAREWAARCAPAVAVAALAAELPGGR